MAFEPLAARRRVKVSLRRTHQDWAWWVKELVDRHYPQAGRIVLVLDNLNTHTPAALYALFEAAKVWRIAQKLELHYEHSRE